MQAQIKSMMKKQFEKTYTLKFSATESVIIPETNTIMPIV